MADAISSDAPPMMWLSSFASSTGIREAHASTPFGAYVVTNERWVLGTNEGVVAEGTEASYEAAVRAVETDFSRRHRERNARFGL